MSTHCLYWVSSGAIMGHLECPSDIYSANVAAMQAAYPNALGVVQDSGVIDDILYYVLNGVITPRPEFAATLDKTTIAADGIDTATLATLPAGTIVSDGIDYYAVDDGSFEFTVDVVGEYLLTANLWPYQTKRWMVTAI